VATESVVGTMAGVEVEPPTGAGATAEAGAIAEARVTAEVGATAEAGAAAEIGVTAEAGAIADARVTADVVATAEAGVTAEVGVIAEAVAIAEITAAEVLPGAVPAGSASLMARRFRGFLPVVIDVETGGFHASTDALLEIAAVLIQIDPDGRLRRGPTLSYHVKPFDGSRLDPAALSITGIDPFHPLRPALPEKDALGRVFREVRHAIHAHGCRRAILVGHNAAFDLGFINAAVARAEVKRNPFHPFSCFDTATLAGVALGQTVLAKALAVAGLQWDPGSAHSAAYDAERSAEIFCLICNRMNDSFRDAQERARALGWLNANPAEAAMESPLADL